MTQVPDDPRERAGQRLTMDYEVPILKKPIAGKTVGGTPTNHGGHANQKSHGRRMGPISEEYRATYGEVIDEASAGPDNEYVVAYTSTSDMHLAFDDPDGSDREVFHELSPDTARNLADELRCAKDHDLSGDPDREGIVDSVSVDGTDGDIEVWVHRTGDVGIRNVNEIDERGGYKGYDMDSEDAGDLADALDDMADGYEEEFGA